jgi:hypothetical protein
MAIVTLVDKLSEQLRPEAGIGKGLLEPQRG